jgi:Arc/MetJ-type ribon-helix-helix transcriptional regulator
MGGSRDTIGGMAMHSFRLPEDLDSRVHEASVHLGISRSEFVRRSLQDAVDSLGLGQTPGLAQTVRELAVDGKGEPVARRAHEAFGEILAQRHAG